MPAKIAILASALLLALNLSANARTALVIGNGAYTNLSALANPGNDARDMASSLTELGFEVQLLVDASHESIEDAVLDFGEKLHKGGGVGLFYYAGHGVQDQGRNYLIPVEANIRRATQLKRKTVDVGWVLDEMAAANNGLNMVILDACRDNPFAEFRSGNRGLAKMEGPKGTFIAYATAPGDVAADGEGRNGLFTKHLLQAMQQPDQPVELAFKDVVKAVSDESRGRQTPFITSSLTGDFYFNPAGANPAPEQLITLTLRSNVYDDQVYINGAYVGQTKLVTQLAAGWHDIEVRKAGYRTYSARLLLDKDQTLVARLQRGADPAPQPATIQAAIPAPVPKPAPAIKTTPSTIDGLSLDDWLLVYGDNTITTANLDKIIAYEQQHGGSAASRSYINRGLQVALADVDSADDLLEYQRKFGYLPGAPAQIEARLAELLAAGASRQDLIRLRAQFPASATLRLQLAVEYHRAKLFEAAAGEYQSWLGLTDSSHPQRKKVLEALVAAREGRLLYKAGDIIQDCPQCPQMVYVPAASFRMGDIQGGGNSDERPVHRVSVKAFLMSATEVTFAQWDACVAAGGCSHKPSDQSWGRGSRPVINVSWEDAQQYVKWISAKTGEQYRLPAEAEWEYAARAGSDTKYSWGNQSPVCRDGASNGARFDDNKNCDDIGTAPVASYSTNAFGLYDMHGNVWEWTQDCWNGSYKGAPSDGSAWLSGNCSRRVLRGGSWFNVPNFLRSAYRIRSTSGNRFNNNGFRLARTLD